MDAAAALGGWDLATEVAARTQPDTWIEAYPHGVSDHGDIGGDSQAGDAHGRRFVRWVPAIGLWAVINDARSI